MHLLEQDTPTVVGGRYLAICSNPQFSSQSMVIPDNYSEIIVGALVGVEKKHSRLTVLVHHINRTAGVTNCKHGS